MVPQGQRHIPRRAGENLRNGRRARRLTPRRPWLWWIGAVWCLALAAALAAPVAAVAATTPGTAPAVAVGVPFTGTVTDAGADLWRLSDEVRRNEKAQMLIDNRDGSGPLTVCLLGPVGDAGLADELAQTGCGATDGPRYAGSVAVAAGDRDRLSIPYPRPTGRPLIRISRPSGAGRYAVTVERVIRPTAPDGPTGALTDTIRPLVARAARPPRISADHGWFWFQVGGRYDVAHRLSRNGRTLAARTVHTTAARTWRVRLDFDSGARRAIARMRRTPRREVVVWTMTATDRYGNVARQTVRLSF